VTANSFARALALLLPMPLSFTSLNHFLLHAALFYPPRIDIVQTDKLCCIGGSGKYKYSQAKISDQDSNK
jgi:hypothetical protein